MVCLPILRPVGAALLIRGTLGASMADTLYQDTGIMEKPGGFGADSGWVALRAGRKGTGWGLVQPRGQLGGAVSPQSLDAAACTGRVGDIWIQGNTVGARLG